jgi:hypothetical protein
MDNVSTPDLCPSCGRLNQPGHVCPASADAPAMPPGFHPTAGFLRHPQDTVTTHPQDVAAEGALPEMDPNALERAARVQAHRAAAGYSAVEEQLPLPGMPKPKGPPPGVPAITLPPEWQPSDLSRAEIARDVAEDMTRTNAKASEEGMEIVGSTAGQILTRGEAFKERLLHQLVTRAFLAGAAHGAQTATDRAIQFGLTAAGVR